MYNFRFGIFLLIAALLFSYLALPCSFRTIDCGENGKCANLAGQNLCICEPGWRGPNCNKCQPYWACPNQSESACSKPNECLCDTGEPLCNNPSLTLLRK